MKSPCTVWDEIPVLMDIPYACRLLGMKYETVKRQCQRGELPAAKVGHCWRISRDRLREYIEDGATWGA